MKQPPSPSSAFFSEEQWNRKIGIPERRPTPPLHPRNEPQSWVTLDDWVIGMIEMGQQDTVTYRTAISVFGQAKIDAIWERYQSGKKSKEGS